MEQIPQSVYSYAACSSLAPSLVFLSLSSGCINVSPMDPSIGKSRPSRKTTINVAGPPEFSFRTCLPDGRGLVGLTQIMPCSRRRLVLGITSFQAFSSKGQDAFNRCEFGKSFPSYSVRPTNFCLIVLFACLVYPVARKGTVTADTLIKLFAQTFMQSMLELVVISCIYSGYSTSILIGPSPPRSVNKRT